MAVRGGFVTGDGGIGHVAVTSKKPHQVRGYFNTVFDARLSDYIDETISGLKFKIRFLRVNRRHHSVAIAATNLLPLNPIRTRVQHVNVQVAELDDMTASYQRVKELGFHMALGVGQHTNDRELSYYAMTPSGFEWELGWNPIVVDENTWEPTTHQGISIWGHTRKASTSSASWRSSRPRDGHCCAAKTPCPRWPGRHPRRLLRGDHAACHSGPTAPDLRARFRAVGPPRPRRRPSPAATTGRRARPVLPPDPP
ncbi:glyoxalase/Bleomycin resistance /Dioxygenase superfamily protein [Mycobacterium kansasii]|uniref:Glyoxalase/Bleomycin resistance /Dioxygenase superfamily protein n=1 Tax=Mycobacterium kansasii TaxID=1768 RepID=A0A1V3XVE5_MYCKA|nr:glyoxalase/Bleomycin resistance /Dioxygenase superfamily protein [Mycobacterium kansasii]